MTRRAAWVAVGLLLAWAAAAAMPLCVVGSQGVGAGESASAAQQSSPASLARWQTYSEGLPTYAIMVSVATDPADPDVIYAGTYEPPGLWRSDDRGRTWSGDDAGLGGSPVYALHWDAVRHRWWAGARDGLYTRLAGAGSPRPSMPWQATGLRERIVYAIAEDAKGRLYVATEDGLFGSDDADSWEAMPLATDQARMTVLALDVSPDGRTILAGTAGQGLWIGRDGGADWSPASDQATDAGSLSAQAYVSAVLFDPRPSGAAYASTSERAYRSADGGITWQVMAGLEGRVRGYATAPDGSTYAALTGKVARSTDGGRNWEPHGKGLRPDDEALDLAVSSDDPACVYAAAWDGLYISTDRGQSWARRSDGLGYPDVNVLAWDGSGKLLTGTRSGLFRRAPQGAAWEAVPDLQDRAVRSVAVGTGSPRPYFAGCSGGLFRSTDGGRTWAEIESELSDDGIAGLVIDPTDPDHLHAWAAFGRVHESWDGGRNWAARWDGLGDSRAVTAIHQTGAGQLFAGAEDGLFLWEPGGGVWQSLPLPLRAPSVFAVVSDPGNAGAIYVGATDGLWRSVDGMRSWSRWGRGLEGATVTALAMSPTNARIAFAGSRHQGLYATTNGGATWQPAWENRLAAASVRHILFTRDGQVVYVASNQGIWRGDTRGAR